MQKRTKLILAVLLPLQILFLQVLKKFPAFIETYYSNGIFPIFSRMMRFLFGWLPFSIGDIFYLLITIIAIRWIIKNLIRIRTDLIRFILDITATLSIVYFVFNLLWGFNYYRVPLHKTLQIDTDYTTEELISTTNRLIVKSNEMHRQLGYADSLKIDLPYTQKEIFESSVSGFQNLAEQYPNFSYSPISLKKSGWSL
jgi:hypothetical protein